MLFLSGCFTTYFTVMTTYMYFLFWGVCILADRWIFLFIYIFFYYYFFTTKKDGSTGPTALESDGPYFEIMGQCLRPTINLKACQLHLFVCLSWMILYIPVNNFSLMSECFFDWTSTKQRIVSYSRTKPSVLWLELVTSWSQVKHSTTESPCSHSQMHQITNFAYLSWFNKIRLDTSCETSGSRVNEKQAVQVADTGPLMRQSQQKLSAFLVCWNV